MRRLKIPKLKFNEYRFGKAVSEPWKKNGRAETIRKRNEQRHYAEQVLSGRI